MTLNIHMNHTLSPFYISGVIIRGVDGFNDSHCEIIENPPLWHPPANENWQVMSRGSIGSWHLCVLTVLSCKWIQKQCPSLIFSYFRVIINLIIEKSLVHATLIFLYRPWWAILFRIWSRRCSIWLHHVIISIPWLEKGEVNATMQSNLKE